MLVIQVSGLKSLREGSQPKGGEGGVIKMIILDYRGEGGVQVTQKLEYIICEWPLRRFELYIFKPGDFARSAKKIFILG